MATKASSTDHETEARRFLRRSGGGWHFDDVQEGINCLVDIDEMPDGGYMYAFKDANVVVVDATHAERRLTWDT